MAKVNNLIINENGIEKKAILYDKDHLPAKLIVDGNVLTNVSFNDKLIEGTTEVTYNSEYKKNLLNMAVEGNTEQKQYEGSPSVEYPQPIENSTNVSAELRGVNLLDINNVVLSNGATYEIINDYTIKFTPTRDLAYYSIQTKVEIGKQYTVSVENVITNYTPQSLLKSVWVGNVKSSDKDEYGKALVGQPLTFTATSEDLYIKCYICYTRKEGETLTIVKPMVVEGTQALPYQPYFPPTKVDIPSEVTSSTDKPILQDGVELADGTVVPLRFAKLGTVNNVAINKADILTIDKIANKVTYTQYLDLFRPKAPYVENYYAPYSNVGISFNSTILQTGARQRGICTHGGRVGNYWSALDIWLGVGTRQVYWIDIITYFGFNSDWATKNKPTTEEWAIAKEKMDNWFAEQEANGTPFEVLYELPTPIEYDLTNTDLGQQLLTLANNTQNATNIINISADVPVSSLKITHAEWGGKYD